jgi:hypothetical protein
MVKIETVSKWAKGLTLTGALVMAVSWFSARDKQHEKKIESLYERSFGLEVQSIKTLDQVSDNMSEVSRQLKDNTELIKKIAENINRKKQ